MKPRATIVMPLRRQVDAYLAVALRSALAQTVPTEVVVVTAADTPVSNHATLAAAAAGAGDRLVIRERTRPGYAAALNTGFEHARAERVAILLTDDWLDDNAMEASLRQPNDIVSGGTKIWREDADGRLTLILQRMGDARTLRSIPTVEEKARYIGHLFLLSRRLVLEVGGVDETLGDLSGVDDYDLIWCMLDAGASVGFARGPLYNVRDHAGERLTLRPREEHVRSLNRILDKHDVVDPAERARLIAIHEPWYGRTLSAVIAERRAAP